VGQGITEVGECQDAIGRLRGILGLVNRFAWALAGLLAACGDDRPGAPDDLLAQLQALPGVTVEVKPTDTPGVTYFVLRFTQPVDHGAPGQTFQQQVSLIHRNLDAPMVVQTSGYFDYYRDRPVELTNLLLANQISIEHRFFGESRPDPADWTKLTIEQMADDQHVIVAALRTIYPGAFITSGGSKGGMTATYHRRFYPDDVDGTVPYVAPISFGAPDDRYTAFVDAIGPQDCRDKLRAVAVEMLQNRRAAIETRASGQQGHAYTRILLGPAVEGSIAALEWSFWQYYGVEYCEDVPAVTASDDELFEFLDTVAPVGDFDDDQVAAFEAYYYQAYAQLGFPADGVGYLEPHLLYTDADYDGALPTPELPPYDEGAAMQDIDGWVKSEGDRLLFVYGEYDPWTGGKYELGGATDSAIYVQAEGSHGSRINRLAAADREAVYATLERWTGVRPLPPAEKPARLAPVREPRVPPVLIRGLRSRR
jgi:hypothetical protein